MKLNSVQQRMAEALDERIKNGSLRKLVPFDPALTDFSSNDYLGLAGSEDFFLFVRARMFEGSRMHMFGSSGSRLLTGNNNMETSERFLAGHFKAEAGLIFNSGYAANCGIFGCIPKKGDTILFDELIHASVRDGMRLTHAKSWSFRHNDTDHLKELIARAEGNVFVAVESIYSMDGDEAPLEELAGICGQSGASLIVDEAHSTGLYGENGEGLCVARRIEDKVFIRLYTFGKAMGSHGAFVAGSELLKQYLVNFSRPFIYTTALPDHSGFMMDMAVLYISNRSELRDDLFNNVKYFRDAAQKTGLKLQPSDSAIQAMIVPGNENVKALAEKCRNQKLDVRAVLSPTVPVGKERLRIIIHAFNTKAEMDRLIQQLALDKSYG